VLLILVAAYIAWSLLRPLPKLVASVGLQIPSEAASDASLPWPDYGQAAVGTAGYGVIATHGTQKPLPTASTAKVITALAVLRQYPLQPGEQGPKITITQDDVDNYKSYVAKDGSVVQVALGEQISERQALEALLLPSANNMADTLARWAFGSVQKYTDYANAYAQSLGLKSVHVTDPSGLNATTVASAEDLTVIGELAMLNPAFAEIVAEPSATIPVQGNITNYNTLLGNHGNIGIKTGNNDEDKGAYLFAQQQTVGDKTVTVVGAIMGGPDLATVLRDASAVAQAAGQHFSTRLFVTAGQTVGTYRTPTGGTVPAVASQDVSLLTWNGTSYRVSASLNPVSYQAKTGQTVGAITVSNDLHLPASNVSVQLSKAMVPPSWQWRLTHPF